MKTKMRTLIRRSERLAIADAKALNKQIFVELKSNTDLIGYSASVEAMIVKSFANVLILGAAVGLKSLGQENALKLSLEDRMMNIMGEVDYQQQLLFFESAAREMSADVQSDVTNLMFEIARVTREEGLDEKKTAEITRQVLIAKGYSPATARNLKTLYTTGFHLTYNGVRYARTRNSPDVWGYRYQTAGDEKVRDTHIAQQGTTLPKEDPFWTVWLPPAGYNCRCTFDILFEEEKIVEPDRTIQPDPGFENLFMDLRGF